MTDPIFLNRPNNSYLPLRDKPIVITTRTIGGTGAQNKLEFFLLTKPFTIREKATIDLLYPTPDYVKRARQDRSQEFTRVTALGNTRIIDGGLIRVTS